MPRTQAPRRRTTLRIDDLIAQLERLPEAGFCRAANELVQGCALDRASLEPYAFFSTRHYTRNLIHKNALFEMLALCWEPGQQSSVHNHREQECFMLMGEGQLENENFRVLDRDPVRRTCRLVPTLRTMITRDAPMAVDPEEPVHIIRNREAWGTRAMSVHLYSRPFDSCEVYCPDQGIYKDVQLFYWSRMGVVEPGGSRGPGPCAPGPT
jgi:hypothetical protein